MKIENVFSKEDLARIEAAVALAEKRAPGEIVPYIVGRSDRYPEASWRGAAIGGAIGAAIWALLSFGEWAIDPTLPAIYTLGGAAAGFLLARLAPIRRFLAGRRSLERRVEQRARAAFLEREVFATTSRQGVLLFVSVFERRAVVLADAGVPVRPDGETWTDVTRAISAGLAAGRPGEAISDAIARLGKILKRVAEPAAEDSPDQLPNQPITRDE
jgi:putative membrane protein